MALVEMASSATSFELARDLVAQKPPQNAIPRDALAQLSHLRDEAGHDLHLARFLARAPQACTALLIAGTLVALSSTTSLTFAFTWAVMLLIGIIVITGTHIRSFAAARPQLSLRSAASHLRGLLLYTGLVWGSGAFLMLPGEPAPILTFVFAVVPATVLTLILKDRKAAAAFAVPAAVATVMAAALGGWPQALWVGAAILATLPGIIVLPALQQKPPHPARIHPVLR